MHALSAAVASPWTCPQCGRRVPGREPRCHCGLTRAEAASSGRSAPALPASGTDRPDGRRGAIVATVLATAAVAFALYAAIRRFDESAQAAARPQSPLARGEAVYPALPALPALPARPARPAAARTTRDGSKPRPSVTTVPLRPPTAAEADWDSAVALLDMPLRRIAAETSVLELSYRPFAAACVAPESAPASVGTGREGDWLASLKTARLLPGVTLREKGATVDCEGVRRLLVTRADALKSDLDANERLGRTSGVRREHWRQLLAVYLLEGWDRY
jgi:hypothetical protein